MNVLVWMSSAKILLTRPVLASMVGMDSIGFVELRFQCEEEFNIKVEDKEFSPANFYSCQTLSRFIMNKLGA